MNKMEILLQTTASGEQNRKNFISTLLATASGKQNRNDFTCTKIENVTSTLQTTKHYLYFTGCRTCGNQYRPISI